MGWLIDWSGEYFFTTLIFISPPFLLKLRFAALYFILFTFYFVLCTHPLYFSGRIKHDNFEWSFHFIERGGKRTCRCADEGGDGIFSFLSALQTPISIKYKKRNGLVTPTCHPSKKEWISNPVKNENSTALLNLNCRNR